LGQVSFAVKSLFCLYVAEAMDGAGLAIGVAFWGWGRSGSSCRSSFLSGLSGGGQKISISLPRHVRLLPCGMIF